MNLKRHHLYPLVLGLLLLTNIAEVCPRLHEHEAAHACTQYEGRYVYLNELDPSDEQDSGSRLQSIQLGKNHDHHLCALCHLHVFALNHSTELPAQFLAKSAVPCPDAAHIPAALTGIVRSRGSPAKNA